MNIVLTLLFIIGTLCVCIFGNKDSEFFYYDFDSLGKKTYKFGYSISLSIILVLAMVIHFTLGLFIIPISCIVCIIASLTIKHFLEINNPRYKELTDSENSVYWTRKKDD